jgi:hypothetical protein
MRKPSMSSKAIVLVLIFFIFLILPLQAQKVKIKKENGVTFVLNPQKPVKLPGMPTTLKLTEDLCIGKETKDENYMFSRLGSIQVDDDGNIYVLDTKEILVKVYDKNGKHLRTFGKKGQGPGEFQSALRMYMAEREKLTFLDTGNKRFSYYSLNGECLKETSCGKWNLNGAKADSKGSIYGETLSIGLEGVKQKLLKFDPQFNQVSELADLEVKMKPPSVNPMPARFFFMVAKEDNLIWAISSIYELNVINSKGEKIKKIVKDYNSVKITDAEKEKLIKERYGDSLLQDIKLEWPKNYLPLYYFALDDRGWIYVSTHEKDVKGNIYFDVFDAEGRYIARFSHPEGEILFAVKKNKAYFLVEESKEGIPLVKRYSMDWK